MADSPRSASAAICSMAAATTSSSVMAVKPQPLRPQAVSMRASTQDSVLRFSPPGTGMATSMFKGMADTWVMAMSAPMCCMIVSVLGFPAL